jgi:DNA polymerase-1
MMQKMLFPDFKAETYQNGEKIPTALDLMTHEGIAFEYITDIEPAKKAVSILLKGDLPLGLDTETAKLDEFIGHPKAGLDPHLTRIRLIQMYGGGDTVYIFDLFELDIGVFAPLWNLPMVAHNAVFDLKHLLHAGVSPEKIGCTMLMENALTGKLPSLAALSRQYLGLGMSKEEQTSDWNVPELTRDQLSYSGMDAVAVKKLYQILSDLLKQGKRAKTYALMRDAMPAIAQLELNGIHFDVEKHAKLMKAWQIKKPDAAEKLKQVLGPYTSPDSPKQLSDWLKACLEPDDLNIWPKTKTGQLKTDANTLARYPEHPLATPLLLYKEADKMLSTFGTGYTEHINPKTGRIHSNFRLGGTTTGRFSCYSPNIQNPPRDKSFRELFSAPPGRSIIVADYEQIELRIAALVSGDKNMLEIYKRGQDLHKMTAATTADVPSEEVTKDQRQAAKPVNFGLLYGQGYRGLARYAKATYGVNMTENDAKLAKEAFFKAYPDLRSWQQSAAQEAERTKRVVTPCGRTRDFNKEARGYRYTEALNTPIQGGAAEVLMAALSRLPKCLKGIDAKLVNIVHDEIVLEVDNKDIDCAKAALEKAMVEGMLAVFPQASTRNLVESKSGNNWAEAK